MQNTSSGSDHSACTRVQAMPALSPPQSRTLPYIHHNGTDAMERYYELDTTRRRTPYVIVRGMSDFLHPPLVKAGSGEWRSGTLIQNFAEGYKYAIVTASSAVLSTLQLRCERDQIASDFSRPSTAADVAGRHRPPRPGPVGPCTYSISY